MRIDYCDWPTCPKETKAEYGVTKLENARWLRTMYFCRAHFLAYQLEEADSQ